MSPWTSVKLATSAKIEAGSNLRPCPLCGSQKFRPVFEPIKKCRGCGFCLVNPLGEFRGEKETEEYFLNDYLPLHLANRENSLAERRAHINAIGQYVHLPHHPRHLDVGCAMGSMLEEAKAAGWDPTGVETSELAARYAAEHSGCPVHAGTLQRAAFESESFDVVTLMDVIEHVSEPVDLMDEIYRILRPGGVVFILTPNFASFFVWLYGPKAYGVWPDQHVLYFQPSAMAKLLRKAGFARIATGSRDFYADNLRRMLGRKGAQTDVGIKAAFGVNTQLGLVRQIANHVLMHVPIGDKLVSFAQKRP
jgi:2-polyprenyl-3-methyl-5-hydroxy-6-metoxy-1,4-benzoquinol methylase